MPVASSENSSLSRTIPSSKGSSAAARTALAMLMGAAKPLEVFLAVISSASRCLVDLSPMTEGDVNTHTHIIRIPGTVKAEMRRLDTFAD